MLDRVAHYVYIGQSLRACLLGLLYSHTLILSRSKQDRGGNTVFLPSKNTGFLSSPLVTDPDVSPSAGEGEEGQRLGRRRQRGRRPTAGRTVISGRAPAREVLRSLRRCLWADPASRRPPIHIPTTFRYIFVRNRLSSTSPARYVAACASFSTSQPLSIRWSNVTFFLLLEVKLLHGVESCTWFKQKIKGGNLVCTSNLVQTGRKGGESSTDWSSNRSLGRKGKYRGNAVHSGMTRTRFAIHT